MATGTARDAGRKSGRRSAAGPTLDVAAGGIGREREGVVAAED